MYLVAAASILSLLALFLLIGVLRRRRRRRKRIYPTEPDAIKRCSHCGGILRKGARDCPHCGADSVVLVV